MITGSVNAAGEPIVSLRVCGADGHVLEIDAVVDIGFNGLVALPPGQISSLNLPRIGAGRVVYGDGNEADLEVHQAVVEWDGTERLVRVDCIASDVLLGTALLAGHELRITFVLKGMVEITRLP